MPGNLAPLLAAPPTLARPVVLVGLMGAGKTSIGRRLAARLGVPFRDADAEIERAAGCSVPDLFARWGEPAFREGERRVVQRLLDGPPIVLATGGGAFMDFSTRAVVRERATSVWLRVALPILVSRVSGRDSRPLLRGGDPAEILERLAAIRHPVYAEADIAVDCMNEHPDQTTARVLDALASFTPPRRVPVRVGAGYDVLVGPGLLARAGGLIAPALPQRRAVVVHDAALAATHLPTLLTGLATAGIDTRTIAVPSGEAAKSLTGYATLMDALLAPGLERRTTLIALGGGVTGDLAGFAAATALRGIPFVQIPTTLLAMVDSSVGGKTGINAPSGKNLIGAFHQPRIVLADTDTLATLPARERRAGYAEIFKAGLIGDPALAAWCEQNGAAVIAGDPAAVAHAIAEAVAFKAAIVADDEREERGSGGRALLNLGHTFGHAVEAAFAYDGRLLHGEGVGLGLVLAFALSAALGHCDPADAARVAAHIAAMGLPSRIDQLPAPLAADALIASMRHDKKVRDGQPTFILARRVGEAFTTADVPADAVRDVLRASGATP